MGDLLFPFLHACKFLFSGLICFALKNRAESIAWFWQNLGQPCDKLSHPFFLSSFSS